LEFKKTLSASELNKKKEYFLLEENEIDKLSFSNWMSKEKKCLLYYRIEEKNSESLFQDYL
jgi:hypothetical protein